MKKSHQPYSVLGEALRKLREKHAKSQVELSGAVEVPPELFAAYEKGESRPSEDILLLIIQHFDLDDSSAKELWRLAGYEDELDDEKLFINDDFGNPKQVQTIAVTPQDAKIVYTDMVQVQVNNYGVIINFLQGAGPSSQPLAISRVGMSKEHARSIVDVLQKTLEQSSRLNKPRRLMPPQDSER